MAHFIYQQYILFVTSPPGPPKRGPPSGKRNKCEQTIEQYAQMDFNKHTCRIVKHEHEIKINAQLYSIMTSNKDFMAYEYEDKSMFVMDKS